METQGGSLFLTSLARRIAQLADRDKEAEILEAIAMLQDKERTEFSDPSDCGGTCRIPFDAEALGCEYRMCGENEYDECTYWCGRSFCKQVVFKCAICLYGACEKHGRTCLQCGAFVCTINVTGQQPDCVALHREECTDKK